MSGNPLTIANIKDKAKKLKSLTKAILAGTRISPERVTKRMEICFKCPHVQAIKSQDPHRVTNESEALAEEDGYKLKCGICGCRTSGGSSELLNLAAYEETADYGCKHPDGSQWKAAGV